MHLAAQMDVRRSVADPAFDAQVNLVGFLNLMEAGARARTSARGVFFDRRRDLRRAGYLSRRRGASAAARSARTASPSWRPRRTCSFTSVQYGIDYVALRYANVYGPRQDPHGEAGVVAIFCGRILDGQQCTIYGDGKQTRDYVFVGDVVRANLAALGAKVSGTRSISAPESRPASTIFTRRSPRSPTSQPPPGTDPRVPASRSAR